MDLLNILTVNALRFLPLAEVIAIAFAGPLFMTLFGKIFLHEHVGIHRLGAADARQELEGERGDAPRGELARDLRRSIAGEHSSGQAAASA